MSIIGVDVGKQGAHDGRHPRTHVLGREAGKVAGRREWEALGLVSRPQQIPKLNTHRPRAGSSPVHLRIGRALLGTPTRGGLISPHLSSKEPGGQCPCAY